MKVQSETLSDINYDSNYNEIFKNHSLKRNGQMLAMNELDIYLSNRSFSKTNYGNENNEFF